MQGLLLIDKPSGPTSHDIVNVVRARTRLKRVGHTGTLDPLASGLLLVLLGPATKWAQHFTHQAKEYEVEITFGIGTETGDALGRVVSRAPSTQHLPTEAGMEEHLQTFLGAQEQIPPMYSAIKHRGKPLYQWARQGITIPRRPRRIHITRWDLVRYAPPLLTSRVHCSSGTYIRTLAESLGARLHVPAHVSAIRRHRIGPFDVADAVTCAWLTSATPAMIASRLLDESRVTSHESRTACVSSPLLPTSRAA